MMPISALPDATNGESEKHSLQGQTYLYFVVNAELAWQRQRFAVWCGCWVGDGDVPDGGVQQRSDTALFDWDRRCFRTQTARRPAAYTNRVLEWRRDPLRASADSPVGGKKTLWNGAPFCIWVYKEPEIAYVTFTSASGFRFLKC